MTGPAAVGDAAVRIDHLRVGEVVEGGNEYRYRMLLVNNGSRQGKEFKGALALVVKGRLAGKDVTIDVPAEGEGAAQRSRVEFKYFQRLDGTFSVPAGIVVHSIEARLLQEGQVRARQSVVL